MANQIKYGISAVEFDVDNGHRHVSHVIMHEIDGTSVARGVKYTRAQVLQKLDAQFTVETMRWNYLHPEWIIGARVTTYTRNDTRYLRSHLDASTTDNLDNLLPLPNLGL